MPWADPLKLATKPFSSNSFCHDCNNLNNPCCVLCVYIRAGTDLRAGAGGGGVGDYFLQSPAFC